MGKKSRDKGNRFERTIAKKFSEVFNMNIRRVPASGGLDIKSDVYCPEDDRFPYFIECKNRASFRVDSLFSGSSAVYDFLCTALQHSEDAWVQDKYGIRQVPIVVFTGGNFNLHYVVMLSKDVDRVFTSVTLPSPYFSIGLYLVIELGVFLTNCNKKLLDDQEIIIDFTLLQEDDGEC